MNGKEENAVVDILDESCHYRNRQVASIDDALIEDVEATKRSKVVDEIQQPALIKSNQVIKFKQLHVWLRIHIQIGTTEHQEIIHTAQH